MLIFYISMIWYGMVFVWYGMLFLCYAMRNLKKMTWYGMLSYGMVWYAMLCYAMLSFAMIWYGKYGMLWDFNAMLWDFYAMLYYAIVYDGKDKHSATVLKFPPSQKSKYFGIAYWIICRFFLLYFRSPNLV